MVSTVPSKSAAIRARLDHPIIDSDGHLIELTPVVMDFVREIGGGDLVPRLQERLVGRRWYQLSLDQRRDTGTYVTPWWVLPTRNVLDRATASLPRLLAERMDEMGLDFCVLYPTNAVGFLSIPEDEPRQVACRAYNRYLAELYGPYADRLAPAALIPMHTPEEAIAALEDAVGTLGLKAIVIAGYVRRPIPKLAREHPGVGEFGDYYDLYGPESPYDYDPVWAKCVELGVAPTTHSGGFGIGFRRNPWNYMYNHIGHFASVGEALTKSLFFSGVTRRFPALRVALLECGVGWACDVYAGIIARWEKRNRQAVHNVNPDLLDRDAYLDLVARYGEGRVLALREEIRAALGRPQATPDDLDDWSRAGVERPEDIAARFLPHFFFGCEADDPMNAWAFNTKVNPFGARLNAILSSDIGHWDVPDMREVLEEAYELVERELISPADFRDFTFANPVRLYAGMNPAFFKGTRVEAAVAELLKRGL